MRRSVGLLLTISIIAISFAAIFVKLSDAPSTIISMYRMYFACVFLLPIVWLNRSEFKRITKKAWLFLSLAGVFLALHFALWFESLKHTTVVSSTIILALQPIVALLGGMIIYKERTNVRTLVIIGISILGVMMVGWGDFGTDNQMAVFGDLLSFLSVLAVVAYLLIGQNHVQKISHWIYSFSVFFFAGVTLNIYNLVASIPVGPYPLREWGIFLLLALFPTIAHVIYNYLLRYVNTATISISILGEPVGATFLAYIFLNESVSLLQIIGGVIVLLGVGIFLLQEKQPMEVGR